MIKVLSDVRDESELSRFYDRMMRAVARREGMPADRLAALLNRVSGSAALDVGVILNQAREAEPRSPAVAFSADIISASVSPLSPLDRLLGEAVPTAACIEIAAQVLAQHSPSHPLALARDLRIIGIAPAFDVRLDGQWLSLPGWDLRIRPVAGSLIMLLDQMRPTQTWLVCEAVSIAAQADAVNLRPIAQGREDGSMLSDAGEIIAALGRPRAPDNPSMFIMPSPVLAPCHAIAFEGHAAEFTRELLSLAEERGRDMPSDEGRR